LFIKYDVNDDDLYEIVLTSEDGKTMEKQVLKENEIHLNCNSCISGNYLLTLYINGNVACTKVINIKK